MEVVNSQFVIWLFTTVQLLGLASAALARFSEKRSWQASFQGLFFAALALVALVTAGSFAIGRDAWLISGSTLAVMVLATVWDPQVRTASS